MKRLKIFCVLTFCLCICNTGFSQNNSEPIVYFSEFQALGNERFILFSNDQPFIGSVLERTTGNLVNLIRTGRGPFELEQFGGASFDTTTGFLYVTDIGNGLILKFDNEGSGVADNVLPFPFVTHLDTYQGKLLLSPWLVMDKSMRENVSNRFPIGYLANPESLSITDTLFFDMELLRVNAIENISEIDWFTLYPKIVSLDSEGLFLVAFQNFNRVFLLNSKTNKIEQKVSLDIPNSIEPLIHFNESFDTWGQISYSILNDYIRFKDGIYFAFGDKEKEIPYGLIEIKFDADGKMFHRMLMLETDIKDLGYELNITTDGKIIYGTNGTDIITLSFKGLH